MEHLAWLVPLGFGVGMYGTLVGAGGGFILIPLLLLLYPRENPETITSISLAVVFVNALSGSLAYARLRRIDYRSGLLFATATIPGAILGALATAQIPRRLFDLLFGVLLFAIAALLTARPDKSADGARAVVKSGFRRRIVDADGTEHHFAYNLKLGMGLSLLVGGISSLFGIGGGIIHVPALVHLLNFPVHLATATSQFILCITALTGVLVHLSTGTLAAGMPQTVALAIGVILGAQGGARLSQRVRGAWIVRCLALALAYAGARILFSAL